MFRIAVCFDCGTQGFQPFPHATIPSYARTPGREDPLAVTRWNEIQFLGPN